MVAATSIRPSPSPLLRAYLLGLAGVGIFSLSLPMTRLALRELDPLFVTAARLALAGLLGAAYLAGRRSHWPDGHGRRLLAWVIGGVVVAFPLFSALAMRTTDAAHGGVVLAVMPLMTAAAAVLLGGERPPALFWACAASGSLVVASFVLYEAGGPPTPGDGLLVLAAIGAGFGYAGGAALARTMPGLEVIAWALALSLPVTLPGMLMLWPENAASVSPSSWGVVLFLAVAVQFLGFYFFYGGLARGGAARIGQVQLLQVYLTMAAGALLLGERIGPSTLIAALVTIFFVWLGRRAYAGHRSTTADSASENTASAPQNGMSSSRSS
ncbi:MAG: DMT family transporter [Geminicoccaceae bacterium]|nr:DMT family transporter [Geminicoccaceae bacterium]